MIKIKLYPGDCYNSSDSASPTTVKVIFDCKPSSGAFSHSHLVDGIKLYKKRNSRFYTQDGPSEFNLSSKKLYVGNLPPYLSEQELQQYFEAFGHVNEALIIVDHFTMRPKGYGFVKFYQEESLRAVFECQEELVLKGSILNCQPSRTSYNQEDQQEQKTFNSRCEQKKYQPVQSLCPEYKKCVYGPPILQIPVSDVEESWDYFDSRFCLEAYKMLERDTPSNNPTYEAEYLEGNQLNGDYPIIPLKQSPEDLFYNLSRTENYPNRRQRSKGNLYSGRFKAGNMYQNNPNIHE